MATNLTEAAFRPNDWFEKGTASNAAAAATRAAPGAGRKHLLRVILITMSAAPTAAGVITITGGQTVGGPSSPNFHDIAVGSAQTIILDAVDLLCEVNTAVVVTVPALGTGITATVTILGQTIGA